MSERKEKSFVVPESLLVDAVTAIRAAHHPNNPYFAINELIMRLSSLSECQEESQTHIEED